MEEKALARLRAVSRHLAASSAVLKPVDPEVLRAKYVKSSPSRPTFPPVLPLSYLTRFFIARYDQERAKRLTDTGNGQYHRLVDLAVTDPRFARMLSDPWAASVRSIWPHLANRKGGKFLKSLLTTAPMWGAPADPLDDVFNVDSSSTTHRRGGSPHRRRGIWRAVRGCADAAARAGGQGHPACGLGIRGRGHVVLESLSRSPVRHRIVRTSAFLSPLDVVVLVVDCHVCRTMRPLSRYGAFPCADWCLLMWSPRFPAQVYLHVSTDGTLASRCVVPAWIIRC